MAQVYRFSRFPRFPRFPIVPTLILAVVTLLFPLLVPVHAESDAQKITRLEAELADLKAHVGPVIEHLDGTPLRELQAVAGLLSTKVRGLAIDLSAKSGEYCLRDPKRGRFMVHFSERPESTTEDILYFIATDSLAGTGLNPATLPVLPKTLGKMTPRTWYHYDGQALEPHHKGRLGRPYLVMALDIR